MKPEINTFTTEAHLPENTIDPVDLTTLMENMEVRGGLCTALSDMSSSMRALLGLLNRHNCITVLPESSFPVYEDIMGRVGSSVEQACSMIERSRALDRRLTLTYLPYNQMPRQ